MSGAGPISQDWEPVVIRKKAPNAAAKKDDKAVNAARRAGADIDTVKKCLFLIPTKDIRILFHVCYFAKLKLHLIVVKKCIN
jgi:hypothetical protein